MFGCIVAGRSLQTELNQIDETHAAFELPAAEQINHICVFLLGTVPFPDGYGASVHFFWPGKGFQLLGMLSNEKPSAIFRLRGTFTGQITDAHAVFSGASTPMATDGTPMTDGLPSVTAILGLAIEPLPAILDQMSSLPTAAIVARSCTPALPDATILAEKIVKHLFNYISSFVSGTAVTPETPVPLAIIARWYESFIGKVRNVGIGFLDTLE